MSLPEDPIQRIWRVVASIPRGRVESYGSIARRAGMPRRARLVGHALRKAPDSLGLPWHRVVNAAGRISFPEGSGMHTLQRRLLEEEGVKFQGSAVARECRDGPRDLDELLWGPPPGPAR